MYGGVRRQARGAPHKTPTLTTPRRKIAYRVVFSGKEGEERGVPKKPPPPSAIIFILVILDVVMVIFC